MSAMRIATASSWNLREHAGPRTPIAATGQSASRDWRHGLPGREVCVWPNSTGCVALPAVEIQSGSCLKEVTRTDPFGLRYEQRVPRHGELLRIHAGVCVSTEDAQGQSRIQVRVPSVTGETASWARSVSRLDIAAFPPAIRSGSCLRMATRSTRSGSVWSREIAR